MIEIRLYGTSGCHLCEDALSLLLQLAERVPLAIEEVDIAESTELMQRYGLRIPVVALGASGCELGWPFDLQTLQLFIEQR